MSETRTFAVLVDNEPGVLARVIGLFSGRGYNIESLTVTEVDDDANLSRITIVTDGTTQVLDAVRRDLGLALGVGEGALGRTLPLRLVFSGLE